MTEYFYNDFQTKASTKHTTVYQGTLNLHEGGGTQYSINSESIVASFATSDFSLLSDVLHKL